MSSSSPQDKKALKVLFIAQIVIVFLLTLQFVAGLFLHLKEHPVDGDFIFAIGLGSLGASVAQVKKIKRRKVRPVSDPQEMVILFTLMPIVYGTIMSSVAYLLFMSGILSGDNGGGLITTNLFPTFRHSSSHDDGNLVAQWLSIKPAGISETGKLLVWCFIAGYSETFVSGILSNIEKKGIRNEPAEESEK